MNIKQLIAGLIFALATIGNTQASIIGGPATANNCFPFGCTNWEPVYQQVFDASYFTGTTNIASLSFYNTFNDGGDWGSTGNIEISLSTTAATVDNLSNNSTDNLGSDVAVVYTGEISAGTFGDRLDFILTSVFNYDANTGNLLMQVRNISMTSSRVTFFDAVNANSDGMSRLFREATDSYGLVTGFNEAGTVTPPLPPTPPTPPSQIPAPATLALMGLGIVGLRFSKRRA
ncbi:MAG: PEP-CTERM sorting domain-containing protein [Pseudomonadales bacterium]|nr:PEP-CTERM sorting domain-containing protein [Pseudomonadales bacterium]